MVKLRNYDVQLFTYYLRMPLDMFQFLLNWLTPRLQKKDTKFRRPLEPGLKLAVVLRHLAAGDNYPSLQYNFPDTHSPAFCQMSVRLSSMNLQKRRCSATSPAMDGEVALQFQRRWNVSHALCAMGGKHVVIKCPIMVRLLLL